MGRSEEARREELAAWRAEKEREMAAWRERVAAEGNGGRGVEEGLEKELAGVRKRQAEALLAEERTEERLDDLVCLPPRLLPVPLSGDERRAAK